MREIGQIEKKADARTFTNYLYAIGIESEAEESDGGYSIWISDDDQVEQGLEELESFQNNPNDPKYTEGARQGEERWREEKKSLKKSRANEIDVRTKVWGRMEASDYGSITIGLTVISVGVFALQLFMREQIPIEDILKISTVQTRGGFSEILGGQVWRLFTPMFLHFGIFHILFNMMWLRDLGTRIEKDYGMWTMVGLVMLSSLLANVGQYLWKGPNFGGMSGVNFALIGFVWMRHRYDPGVENRLPKYIVYGMMAWYFICMTGLVGPIANMAHTMGLVVGVLWGFLTSWKFKRLMGK